MLYRALKNIINHKEYEKEDMIRKLNAFLLYNQISSVEYKELMDMINNNESEVKR